jgi:hypothetical protein
MVDRIANVGTEAFNPLIPTVHYSCASLQVFGVLLRFCWSIYVIAYPPLIRAGSEQVHPVYRIIGTSLWRIGCTVIPANVASTFSRTPFCFPLMAFR